MALRATRYIEALEGPAAERQLGRLTGQAAGRQIGRHRAIVWPEGMARTVYDAEYALEPQFLDDARIGAYLECLARSGRPHESRAGPRPESQRLKLAFAELQQTWTAETYPLMLCEFLAYKCSLAYRAPRAIRRDLMAVGSDGRRYNEGIEGYAFFDTTHPSSSVRYGDTQAFAFVHQRTGYVIFRGTSSLADLWSDLRFETTTQAYPKLGAKEQTLIGKPAPERHTGFAIAWGSVAPDVEAWTAAQQARGLMDKVVFSGHSLGGALAILAAHQFAQKRIAPVHAVITFGAPKVGGGEFKNSYDMLGLHNRTLRIEAAGDAVASFQGLGALNAHVGHAWPFQHRPLRPAWQMLLISWLIDRHSVARAERENARTGAPATRAEPAGRQNAPSAQPQRTWRAYLFGLALRFAWRAGRAVVRLQAAHSVEHRYGLFISTLAYRKIRAWRIDQAQAQLAARRGQELARIVMDAAYKSANADLRRHLAIVRGRHPRSFRHLAKLPIAVASPSAFERLTKSYRHYIA